MKTDGSKKKLKSLADLGFIAVDTETVLADLASSAEKITENCEAILADPEGAKLRRDWIAKEITRREYLDGIRGVLDVILRNKHKQ